MNPDEPRAWFQLGRAYWSARSDTRAFEAFSKAADLDYAPAMKYLGDAFLEGRGLPPNEHRDIATAMHWYKKACGKPCNPAPGDEGHDVPGFPDWPRPPARRFRC